MDAITLLTDAQNAGLSVSVVGGVLRVRGPKQAGAIANLLLSRKEEIVPLLAAVSHPFAGMDKPNHMVPLSVNPNEDFEERAAICEYDGGLSREWAEGLARICTMARPVDILPPRWRSIVNAAGQFANQWAQRANEVGWTVEQVFGIQHDVPVKQVCVMGLLCALADPDTTMVDLTEELAIFEVGRNRVLKKLHKDALFTCGKCLL
ncbi:MAG: hypothetical protein HQM06_17615 [Magnetococcales bacterium]|nr:hypothetical protein [Magnetococcales bacterium]